MLTEGDEEAFAESWRQLGLSVDWTLTYATIDPRCRRVSQLSFLDLFRKGKVYQSFAPTMWDVDFRTAVAQAEVEDRPRKGAFHDLRFAVDGGGEVVISTTRPELLGACIAVVAHPDDARYSGLFGKTAITPLFHAPVPILPAEHADPEKGTGILMVCTFGDVMDVEYWKRSEMPHKQLVGADGRMMDVDYGSAPFESRDPELARRSWAELAGLTVVQARRRIAEMLAEEGSSVSGREAALVGEPTPHRTPGEVLREGRPPARVSAHPPVVHPHSRRQGRAARAGGARCSGIPVICALATSTGRGLNQDWCISRQRYSGVPFPIWYPLDDDGAPDYENPMVASEESLPLDPLAEAPPGYSEAQRDQPGGFGGDP